MSAIPPLFFAFLTFFASIATAQTTTTVYPTPAATGVTPGVGSHGYSYIGCWNETTGYENAGGVRALAGGAMESTNTMTTDICLAFCANSSAQLCGLEYGRECWYSQYLNSFSTKLADSKCSDACVGNASEVCGGSLAITLYNLTNKAELSGANALLLHIGGAAAAAFAGAMGMVVLLAL